jgi:hypothetical protein
MFGADSGMKGEEERRDLLSPTSVVNFTFRRGASEKLLQMREAQNFYSAAATTFKSRPASRGMIVEPEVGDSKIEDGPAVPRNSSTFPPLHLKSILKKSLGIQKYSSCDEAQAATERRGVEWNSDPMRGFRSNR